MRKASLAPILGDMCPKSRSLLSRLPERVTSLKGKRAEWFFHSSYEILAFRDIRPYPTNFHVAIQKTFEISCHLYITHQQSAVWLNVRATCAAIVPTLFSAGEGTSLIGFGCPVEITDAKIIEDIVQGDVMKRDYGIWLLSAGWLSRINTGIEEKLSYRKAEPGRQAAWL